MATGIPLRLVPGGPRGRGRWFQRAGWLFPTVLALAVAVVLYAVGSQFSSERRGLRSLPPETRAVLVARAVDDLRSFCGDPGTAPLREHCRELASFAANFQECSGDCEALVRRQLTPNPTR